MNLDLNLGDLNRIIEGLFNNLKTAENENYSLTASTLSKIVEARSEQLKWLVEEYSKN